MKKLLSILGLMLLSVAFFSCDKDGDGCYDFEDHTDSIDINSSELDNSGE